MATPRLEILREPFAGAALLTGAVLGFLVMLFHPTGHELVQAADQAATIRRDRWVHALAIVAMGLQGLGAVGFVRRLAGVTLGLAELGAVAYALASVGGVIAALASGFMAPRLLAMGGGVPPPDLWRFNAHCNQVAAALYVVAGSVAIGAWSFADWRGALPRWLAGFGAVTSTLAAPLVVVGHLRLDVHGFGAVVLAQGVFWCGAGVVLWRGPAGSVGAAA